MAVPVALVLDDVHVLDNPECWAAVSVLADHVPCGSHLVLAGRSEPAVRIARLRAEGKITEIGARDLAFTRDEASSLLHGTGVTIGEDEVAELYRRTEGWPAGLYLAALHQQEGGLAGRAPASFTGGDRLVSEYIESEFLARIPERDRVFLTRTAVLGRMCGPLCDAVLGWPGSAAVLAGLARSDMLLVPLDQRGRWYRYHQLFRDMLLAQLHRQEPELIPVLRRRAAGWCVRNGLPEEALEYSIAAGDVDAADRLVSTLAVTTYRQGRVATLQRWLRWLDDRGGIEGHPMAAVLASLLSALTGRSAEAARWADVVDRWHHGDGAQPGDPSAEAWAALLRAMLCRGGVEQLRTDADDAARKFAAMGVADPAPVVAQGIACILSGDLDGGDAFFEDAVTIGEGSEGQDALAIALCERSLVAMDRGDWSRAQHLADQARAVLREARIEETFATPLVCAVQARATVHHGDIPAARQALVNAQRLRPVLTYALPYFAVQARIELARACIALADPAGARTLMREIDELLERRPGLGTLAGQAQELRTQLSRLRSQSIPGASALTAAELRLLPMLATHLSFRDIAGQLSLSRSTIKVQAASIYRKLGASSRNQAVMRARDLGLLEEVIGPPGGRRHEGRIIPSGRCGGRCRGGPLKR